MTETRIRWHEADRSERTLAWLGYAGTVNACLFQILKPVKNGTPGHRFDEWGLCATFPGAHDKARYAYSLDEPQAVEELKAQAERWLEEFTSSLGAIFPAESATPRSEWHDGWSSHCRDGDGNLILRYKPTGGLYRVLPVEES